MGALGIMMLRRGTMANPIAGSDYIKFADAEVERILMSKGVSSDGVGITREDAARVASIGSWFTNNTTIESFEELRFFTGLTRIGIDMPSSGNRDAFSGCSNLKSIELPESLTTIGTFAFFRCPGLQKVGMPKGITSIGAGAFRSAGAPSVIDLTSLASLPGFSDIGLSYTFRSSNVVRVENLGNVKTTYGQWNEYDAENRYGVFYECALLEYADIRNLETIGACMFGRCSALKDVIMEKAKEIGYGAFISCHALESLKIPASVNIIRAFAISYCNALKEIIVEASIPPTVENTSIGNVPSLESIYVPDASISAYKAAANWSYHAARIKGISEYQG